MAGDPVTRLHLILAPGADRTYTLYDDDGVSNDYQKGFFRKTSIRMSGKHLVTVSFHGEGEYPDSVETVLVEMIHKESGPILIRLGDTILERLPGRRQFEEAETGWFYSMEKRAVLIKYPNPKRDITLFVSFEPFDLIGM